MRFCKRRIDIRRIFNSLRALNKLLPQLIEKNSDSSDHRNALPKRKVGAGITNNTLLIEPQDFIYRNELALLFINNTVGLDVDLPGGFGFIQTYEYEIVVQQFSQQGILLFDPFPDIILEDIAVTHYLQLFILT